MSSPEYNEEREDYANLADEASCEDAHPWNDDDWDQRAVKNAKKYAREHNLNWPPGLGDFDRWYDLTTNGELESDNA